MRNIKNTLVLYGSSVLLAASLVGCASHGDERTMSRKWDDRATAHRVKKGLADAPVYKFGEVGVTAYNGQVQLNGFVETEEQKRIAGDIARNSKGVTEVVNNIEIKPGTPVPTGRAYQPPANPPPPPAPPANPPAPGNPPPQ
jgi:osmotically-inducible protein OsmY